jgi:iron transport multicopper oxidase
MIEAPLDLQAEQTIPQDFYNLCSDQGLPYQGNAAGNTVDLLDLDGANKSVPPLPAGFTAKGYVALVFSVVSAVLGMISITRSGSLSTL